MRWTYTDSAGLCRYYDDFPAERVPNAHFLNRGRAQPLPPPLPICRATLPALTSASVGRVSERKPTDSIGII